MRDLTDHERRVLSFDKQWWRRPGAKETAIRNAFDLAPPAYYLQLNTLLDEPAALVADPVLITRLRAGREHQLRLRAPRRGAA